LVPRPRSPAPGRDAVRGHLHHRRRPIRHPAGISPRWERGHLRRRQRPRHPLAQGCLRLSHRRTDPARSTPWQPFHPHDTTEPARPGQAYRLDIELWPTCIILPPGATLALTVTGRDFARGITCASTDPRQLAGRGSGTFLHCDPADRPAPAFTGQTTLHTGGGTPARVLLPIIPPETPGRVRGRHSQQAVIRPGRSFRARFTHWYTVTDGKIAHFEQVVDSAKVNEAL
jgi:hypothetical protein